MQHTLRVTISALSDDVLLGIFKFYMDPLYSEDAWQKLVHVCRKWRFIVFASPRWLHLELRCTNRRPVRKMLDIWPTFPIVIDAQITESQQLGLTNVIAALDRHDRVCRIKIWGVPISLLKSAAIKKPFPKLTHLMLRSSYEDRDNALVIPDSFLGGSLPRLQILEFRGIPFLALGKLLLSATDLVILHLLDIPNSGIISPEQFVTGLSTSTMLQRLSIGFRSPRSRADRGRRHAPLSKRLVLPSLTEIYFVGDSEYLEDIVGRINAPALDKVSIRFFNQLIFDAPLLRDFFSRTAVIQEAHQAGVFLTASSIEFTLYQREGTRYRRVLEVGISSSVQEWQLSSLAQFCSTSLPPLPRLECLSISTTSLWGPQTTDDMDSAPWLELIHPFVSVKVLVLSRLSFQNLGPALGELTVESITEVLPELQCIFVDRFDPLGRIEESISQFIVARQLSGRPVIIASKQSCYD